MHQVTPFSIFSDRLRLTNDLTETVRRLLSEELATRLDEQQTTINEQLHYALRSNAPTPVPTAAVATIDMQAAQKAQVVALLSQGSVNAAFQQVIDKFIIIVFFCEFHSELN